MNAAMPMWPSARDLRVGDAERDRAAAALGRHYSEGRLDRDEFEERLTLAYAARTRGDLDGLFADLPPIPRAAVAALPSAPAAPAPGERHRFRLSMLRVLTVALLLMGLATHSSAAWLLFVLCLPPLAVGLALSGARRMCRYVGSEITGRLPASRY
ncbi:MAG: DUF1707 SHOCT-like domain-containing protein [Actinomycetes bacterium]